MDRRLLNDPRKRAQTSENLSGWILNTSESNGEMTAAPRSPVRFERAVPQFTVPDVVRAAEYYRDVLGFEIAGYWQTPPVFAIVRRDAVSVYFNRAGHGEPRTGRDEDAYDAYFHVNGVDRLSDDLRARGAGVPISPWAPRQPQRRPTIW
jgi:hypothetical protein